MKKIIQIATFLALCACSNKNTLTLELSNASGLSISNPVYSNGLAVGEIDNLRISPDKSILVTIELTDELQQIPIDSKITMNNDGLFGGKALYINLGTASEYFNSSDTIELSESPVEQTSSPDPLGKVIEDGINKLTSRDKLDSILVELRRLNENLEKHMKEHNKR